LEDDPPLIDDQFEEEVLETPLREDRDDSESRVTRTSTSPRRRNRGNPTSVAITPPGSPSPIRCAIS
jgi:hypothetical protein